MPTNPSIETKEIGISIGIGSGTYNNTEFVAGNIQLSKIGENNLGEPVYQSQGSWVSDVLDLVDKFKEYDKVVLSKVQDGTANYAILTRTSDDKINFSEYVATTPEGKIQSDVKRYIQIRIDFFAGFVNETLLISDFNSPTDVNKWSNNEFIETDGALKLKRNYEYEMTQDDSWKGEGSLYRQVIQATKFKRIDSISVE
jgi:hypothetical protein